MYVYLVPNDYGFILYMNPNGELLTHHLSSHNRLRKRSLSPYLANQT